MIEHSSRLDHVRQPGSGLTERGVEICSLDIQELINEIKARRQAPILTPEQEERVMELLSGSQETAYFYEETFTQITSTVSSLIEDFEELGIDRCLFEKNPTGRIRGVKVEWSPLHVDSLEFGGSYYPKDRKIAIFDSIPTAAERVIRVARSGAIHPVFLTLAHEFSHDLQYNIPLVSNSEATMPLANDLQLDAAEAQSYLISNYFLDNDEICDLVLGSEDVNEGRHYPSLSLEAVVSTVESFSILNALGISQRSIAEFVRDPGDWDESSCSYTNIHTVVTSELEKTGLTVDEILKRDQLLKARDALIASSIATREILHYMGRLFYA